MKRRFASSLLVALCLMTLATPLAAAPEELAMDQVRQEMMQNAGPVDDFLNQAKEDLNKGMKEAMDANRISQGDPEGIKAEMAKHAGPIFKKAAELRPTLKEPEHRLKLDMEIMQLALVVDQTSLALEILKNWKGGVQHLMALTIAQGMQQRKIAFPPELDTILAEVMKSDNPQFASAAKKFSDPFQRNPVGMAFPDFPAGKTTTDGKELSLKRFKGKVLLVDFWATWCPPCRAEVPSLVEAYEKYKDKGFEIVGISFDQEREKFDAYLKDNKMPWPQYFDGKGWENEIGPTYGIQSIPAMYLLDAEGKVLSTDLRQGKLEAILEKTLK